MDQLNLTEAEKKEIVRRVEVGEPLPDKYRFLLFQDKREVELVWNGKTFETTNLALPFQTIETVDEPLKTLFQPINKASAIFHIGI